MSREFCSIPTCQNRIDDTLAQTNCTPNPTLSFMPTLFFLTRSAYDTPKHARPQLACETFIPTSGCSQFNQ